VTAWHAEPINKKHDREAFDCGEEALNEFLRRYARKSHERGGAKTFLAIEDAGSKSILGFYSLSPASVDYSRTPEIVRHGLARYDVPGFRLARLAVASGRGRELGGNSCWRRADAACWPRRRLAASCWLSMPRMKRWRDGMPAMALCRCSAGH
jgi:hypothetical protein